MTDITKEKPWFVYLIRTKSGHLYTGITVDVIHRLAQHEAGKGAKYLKGKAPLQLVYYVNIGDRRLAAQYEYKIKQLKKQQKEKLVENQPSDLYHYFSILP